MDNKLIKLQALIRGWQARNRFRFNHLSKYSSEATVYPVCMQGNDPKQSLDKCGFKRQDASFLLVGTSGLRNLSIALEIMPERQKSLADQDFPLIIIVDNSLLVAQFWSNIKMLFADSKNQAEFHETYKTLSEGFFMLDEDAVTWIAESLFPVYGYDMVRSLVANVQCILQDWADVATFKKIKNIATHRGQENAIYVYASNIVACCYEFTYKPENGANKVKRILENIQTLNPRVTVHTNLEGLLRKKSTAALITEGPEKGPERILSWLNIPCEPTQTRPVQFSV